MNSNNRTSLLEKYNTTLNTFGLHLGLVGNNDDILAVTFKRHDEIKILAEKIL